MPPLPKKYHDFYKPLIDELVRQGFAVAYRKYSKRYVEAEEAAKKAKIGVWQGPFVMPREWRRGKRLVKPHE